MPQVIIKVTSHTPRGYFCGLRSNKTCSLLIYLYIIMSSLVSGRV